MTRDVLLQEALAVDLAEGEVTFLQRPVVFVQARGRADAGWTDRVEDRGTRIDRTVLVQVDVAADGANRVAQYGVRGRLAEDRIDRRAAGCAAGGKRHVRVGDDRDRADGGRIRHRLAIEVDVLPLHPYPPVVLDTQHHVAFAVHGVGSHEGRELRLARMAVLHRAVLTVDRDALEVLLEDEVDDARHGVGTIHGGCAASNDLDAINGGCRDRIDIDGHRGVDRDGPITIDENQVAVGAEASEADGRGACRRGGPGVDQLAVGDLCVSSGRRNELRHLVQRVFDANRGLVFQCRRIDGLDRAVGFVIAPDDTGAGDDDLVQGFAGGLVPGRRSRRLRMSQLQQTRLQSQCDGDRDRTMTACELGNGLGSTKRLHSTPPAKDTGRTSSRWVAQKAGWFFTNCETIHFSPRVGARPACSVRTSGRPSAKALTKKKPSPAWPLWLTPSRGNSVAPPS